MKYSELDNKGEGELQELLKESRLKLGKLNFQLANKSLKNHSQIGKVKKDVAKILTAMKANKNKNG